MPTMLATRSSTLTQPLFRYRNNSCLGNKHTGYKRIFRGKKQVWLTVGKQTGPGANVVQASTPKLLEQVTFTASTQRGAVFKINADLGTNQIAETNAQPLELLSAVVRDANDNLLPNVPVVFTIEEGDASFPDTTGVQATTNPNGANPNKVAQRIILATDKNGLVALRPQIGTVEGTIRIKAQALKLETGNVNTPTDLTGNATFLIQAREAKDGPASFSGFVYDDKSKPLSGIKLSIGRTNIITTTDASGKFELGNIPPGRIDLFVDGRTFNPITTGNPQTNDTTKPQYPSLHFEAYAIKGRDNQIAHPIYLPALSTSPDSVKTVGGNEDVILKIPGLAGFQMKVKANSVTFPDGSRVGTLIVSPVTADKLPMNPPAGGAQFGVPAWTIQPAGTRFDPPIEVTLPNASSQPVGDNLPIVQWDHDLGQYVAMGRATVSEDGAVLVTDSGSGITKAGWGGLCRYDPDKCGKNAPPAPVCNDCQKLEAGTGDCPTGNCATLPNIATVKSGKCCGGSIIDTEKSCCAGRMPAGSSTKFYFPAEKNKPLNELGLDYRGLEKPLQQYAGPPPRGNGFVDLWEQKIGDITYEIDGCSVPTQLHWYFTPGLFKKTHELAGASPMALGFHQACKQHDICYQTCGSQQPACDSALFGNLESYCNGLSPDTPGSGFYDFNTPLGAVLRISEKNECLMNASKMLWALRTGGFPAHNDRQNQMCVVCK